MQLLGQSPGSQAPHIEAAGKRRSGLALSSHCIYLHGPEGLFLFTVALILILFYPVLGDFVNSFFGNPLVLQQVPSALWRKT